MTENRLRLEVRDEWETTDEHDVDLDLAVDMHVETHLNRLAWVGVVSLGVGAILSTVGAFLFVTGYPNNWYGLDGNLAAGREHVRLVVSLIGLGLPTMMMGASLFFYGRRTRGTGESGPLRLEAS